MEFEDCVPAERFVQDMLLLGSLRVSEKSLRGSLVRMVRHGLNRETSHQPFKNRVSGRHLPSASWLFCRSASAEHDGDCSDSVKERDSSWSLGDGETTAIDLESNKRLELVCRPGSVQSVEWAPCTIKGVEAGRGA